MDIRAILTELNGLLQKQDYNALEQKCDEYLATPELPVNYRVLLLDQKIKALAGQNRPADAVEACLEELPLMERLFDANHPHVANILHNLSMFLGAADKHVDAVPYAERELAIIRKCGPGTSREADALVSLAEHIYEQSQFAEADKLLLQALALYEKNDGRRSLGVSTCLNNLGRSSENQGENEKGVKYLEEAASIRNELLGAHPDSAFTLLNYGTGLSALGEFEKAAQTLTHCVAIYEALGMQESPYAKAAQENLNICLTAIKVANEEPMISTSVGSCCCCRG